MEQPAQEISTLVGRQVYSISGTYVGEVEDVRIDLDAETATALAITDSNPAVFGSTSTDAQGVMLPYRWIRAVDDIILVNDIVDRLEDRTDSESEA